MSQLHVVGMVGNDIVNDSRVKKAAASAAAAGFRSTILCYTTGPRSISQMGEVTVVRVPVPFHARDRHRRVPGPMRPFLAKELSDRHLGPRADRQAKIRRLRAESAAGVDRNREILIERALLWADHNLFRLRRRAGISRDRALRLAYRTLTRMEAKALKSFRNPVGQLLDYEVVFGPELEALEPDLVHAHDYHMIGVAVNAARFLRARGIDTRVLYDAHELVEGLSYPPEVIDGWLAEEARYINDVDGVIGVSLEQVSRIKERYGLDELPPVVHNAPLTGGLEDSDDRDDPDDPDDAVDGTDDQAPSTVRDRIPRGKILVYHGNVAEERGVFTLVEALPMMSRDVHAAIVAPPNSPLAGALYEKAVSLGVRSRLHVLEFVPPERLSTFLGSADVAVIPYMITGNNDIALPNKLFESIQAGLPVLTSNMRALSRFVTEHAIGRVFEAGDAQQLAAQATAMLADIESYRRRLTPELRAAASWDSQAETLVSTYRRILQVPDEPHRPIHVVPTDIQEQARPTDRRRLAIGPRNMAGQAHELARAVERHLGFDATSFGLVNGRFEFPADRHITSAEWKDPAWQSRQIELIASTCSHVLTESGTGIYGAIGNGFVDEQLDQMRSDELEVAVLLHGSEIRDPRRHRHLPFSPYATGNPLIRDLEAATARLRRHLEGLDVPFFVTTPDLLADIEARWLPVVVDPEPWRALEPAFGRERPVVLHLPTNGLLKGSDHVDEVLFGLQEEGLVDYLRPGEPLRPEAVAAMIEQSDIVIDGIVLGAYGVMSCQTMAASRIAIANIRDVGEISAHCPIVDASPSTLEAVLRDLVAGRDAWADIAEAGQRYVDKYHDGSYSASQLADFLGI